MRWQRHLLHLFALVLASGWNPQASAQPGGFDPRMILGQVIAALQNCGPPQVYQMFGAQLFQTVAMQTGGSGCYMQLKQLGPVTGMNVTGQQQFPAGPVYAIRVQHQAGATDWFMGISQATNKIEYLNFQPAQAPQPNIKTGPIPKPDIGGGTTPNPTGNKDGCSLYPAMCNQ